MRILIGSLACLCCIAIGACGGTEVRTVVKTVDSSATTPTTDTVAPSAAEEKSCDALGINSDVTNEGACTRDGIQYVIANRASVLRLKTLSVKIESIRTTPTLSGSYDSATAHGTFVVAKLTVRNRSNEPQQFGSVGVEQTYLLLGKRHFSESFSAENGPDEASFVNQDDNTIQPGNSLTGDIVFDIPPSAVPKIDENGNLGIVNFGDDLSFSPQDISQVGVFRLYH